MVVWNRDLTYRNKLTTSERKAIARSITTPGAIQRAKKINTLINLWVPVILCYVTKFNPIVLAVSFIIVDMLLCAYDHLRFIVVPHFITSNMSLSDAQKRLEKIERQREELEKDIKNYKDEHVCGLRCNRDCSNCALTIMQIDK